MNQLNGGTCGCSCACNGPSSSDDNAVANLGWGYVVDDHYGSPGGGGKCYSAGDIGWTDYDF